VNGQVLADVKGNLVEGSNVVALVAEVARNRPPGERGRVVRSPEGAPYFPLLVSREAMLYIPEGGIPHLL
jgi:hypothetical protein